MITENSKLTFGKHKGTPLKYCPPEYLKWLSENLGGGDFHEWAKAAGETLRTLETEGAATASLEKQADEFLRKHGVDPQKYKNAQHQQRNRNGPRRRRN